MSTKLDYVIKQEGVKKSAIFNTNTEKEPLGKLYDIYFYFSEVEKFKTINGVQFVTQRYIEKYKELSKAIPVEDTSNSDERASHQSSYENSKSSSEDENIELK